MLQMAFLVSLEKLLRRRRRRRRMVMMKMKTPSLKGSRLLISVLVLRLRVVDLRKREGSLRFRARQ
jgi:hypothetical protein